MPKRRASVRNPERITPTQEFRLALAEHATFEPLEYGPESMGDINAAMKEPH